MKVTSVVSGLKGDGTNSLMTTMLLQFTPLIQHRAFKT